METLAFNGITATIGGQYHLANIEGLLISGLEFASYNIPQSNTHNIAIIAFIKYFITFIISLYTALDNYRQTR